MDEREQIFVASEAYDWHELYGALFLEVLFPAILFGKNRTDRVGAECDFGVGVR